MAPTFDQTTVMGPAMTITPRKPTDPPPFTLVTNKFKWRQQVRTWVRIVKRMSDGGCKIAKATNSALGDSLYLAVDESSRYLLDHALHTGELSLDPAEDDPDQSKMIEKILDIVAEESPTESIKRLVSMMQDVHQCVRHNNESPIVFARRFKGLASLYLNNCHSGNTIQDSQLFAMILLQNAKLPETTMNHLILQLISESTTKGSSHISENVTLSEVKVKSIMHSTANIASTLAQEHADISICQQMINQTSEDLRIILELHDKRTKEFKNIPNLTLNAAARAVSEISVNLTDGSEKSLHGTMLGKRVIHHQPEPSSNNKRRIPIGEGPKANSNCKACGKKGHWWKDQPACVAEMKKRFSQSSDKPRHSSNQNDEPKQTAHAINASMVQHDDTDVISAQPKEKKSFFRH